MDDEKLKYDQAQVECFDELVFQTKKVLCWIGNEKEVLEIGCHTGHLASWLKKNKCRTFGIDNNAVALEKAKPFLTNSIMGNIEEDLTWDKINERKFDYITFLHVLEHLVEPQKVLNKAVGFLNPDGIIVVGLPNVCNAKDRFNISFGKFDYTVIGVMDSTHLRFYNQKTARELIEKAGLLIEDYFSPVQVNPFKHFFDHLPLCWRFAKHMSDKPPGIFKKRINITDTVMLFKCKRNEKSNY